MRTLQELLIEYWYDQLDLESIKKWAYSYISENDDIPEELFELLDADKYQFESLLLKLSMTIEKDFSSQSVGAEILAAKHLIKVAANYLEGKLTPVDVCRVVGKIDSGFLGAPRGLPKNVAYYPNWLGNLYDSCDWCDETWTSDSAPHLKSDLEAQLVVVEQWIESHNNSSKKDAVNRASS
ncbi:hypothetical protein PVT67_11125 [Gallaecimonas kandeliae]|uniref:hypothetical protein n=1 Tax=Gallaecimonas kandeliae TaxID=3029055 RepID=UPI00264782D7|nr:hypothetical protein [Gallaecimonas kandeliae]WKE64242.1 hypothetical protein PVT67_11125 [Gallaecimonas kandeliae]